VLALIPAGLVLAAIALARFRRVGATILALGD
jgi:hypothetical protein